MDSVNLVDIMRKIYIDLGKNIEDFDHIKKQSEIILNTIEGIKMIKNECSDEIKTFVKNIINDTLEVTIYINKE